MYISIPRVPRYKHNIYIKMHTKNTQTLPKILKIRKRKQWNKSVRKKQADIRW